LIGPRLVGYSRVITLSDGFNGIGRFSDMLMQQETSDIGLINSCVLSLNLASMTESFITRPRGDVSDLTQLLRAKVTKAMTKRA